MKIERIARKAGLVAGGVAVAVAVTVAGPVQSASAETPAEIMRAGLKLAVDAGYPGATALLRKGDTTQYLTEGVGNRATGTPMDPKAQFRAGSNTKPFISAVVLMLADEGRLTLDDTVDKWLPGVVSGNGHDGTKIKLRQLMNHSSGVAEYLDNVTTQAYDQPTTQYTPEQLVRIAMREPAEFAPGAKVRYVNTNYILLGMIIKAVTGNEPATEVKSRLIDRLGLTGTSYPTSDRNLYGNFTRGYAVPKFWIIQRPYVDVTVLNVQFSGAAGAMVSTMDDLATLHRALLDGTLLSPAMLQEVKTDLPITGIPGWGLGPVHETHTGPGTCGRVLSKGGAIYGYYSQIFTREDTGAQVSYVTNQFNMANVEAPTPGKVNTVAVKALCAL
ncbi:serine hydrolase domain-containing protein [Spirillospora sp. NPDC127200]